jgi:hypothetical protein
VHGDHGVAASRECVRVQGEGCTVLHARCHAGLCAVQGKKTCARLGTQVPFSVSRVGTGEVSVWAREWPTGGVGSGRPLGNGGGVQRMSLARLQQEACLLHFCPLGRAQGGLRVLSEGGRVGFQQALAGGVEGAGGAVARC